MEIPIVVTRHPALVAYLREIGLINEAAEVVSHATADQVRGRIVYGILPLHLAAEARSVVHIPLAIPPGLLGQRLTCEQIRHFAGPPEVYRVTRC